MKKIDKEADCVISELSLLGLNVGGITSKLRYNILTEYIKNHDILFLSEGELFSVKSLKFYLTGDSGSSVSLSSLSYIKLLAC